LAGCIVLYNPCLTVITNIGSYINYVDVLYVIDNSENSDDKLINAICLISKKIAYLPQYENTGIASALNLAASLAVENNYHWMLTMDQDSCFSGSSFFDLFDKNIQGGNVGLLAAAYTTHKGRWKKEYSQHFDQIHFVVTSGNIINLSAWKVVDGYEEKLFIDEVDHDYCLKLRKNRFQILITKEILMQHSVGEVYQKADEGAKKGKRLNLHTPVRYYYISRNVLYLCKTYFFVDFRFVLARFFYLLRRLNKIVLFYPDKMNYLRYYFAGIKDFTLSRYYKIDK